MLVFLEKDAFSCAFELLFLGRRVERGAVMLLRLFRFEFVVIMDIIDRLSCVKSSELKACQILGSIFGIHFKLIFIFVIHLLISSF